MRMAGRKLRLVELLALCCWKALPAVVRVVLVALRESRRRPRTKRRTLHLVER